MVLDASGGFDSPHIYRFDVRGAKVQSLGQVALPDDTEAIAFADRIIAGLINLNSSQYRGCTMDIAEDQRCVARITF